MTRHEFLPVRHASEKPISIAILAMGGQGGGVLAEWIVTLAESEGWFAQSTSVPGVAQRTGATIYYIEIIKAQPGKTPVLALMPTPGDVDVVIAAEFMEAGRSILRGLVTPDRTTLIASTHRSFAVSEKERPGDGIADPHAVTDAAGVAAHRTVAFDMQALAEMHGSMISSTLLGALAATAVLPFPRIAYEHAIQAGGKGAEASLRAFAAAYQRAQANPRAEVARAPAKRFPSLSSASGHPALHQLAERARAEFPLQLHAIIAAGIARVVDFQDPAYGEEYLDQLAGLLAADTASGGSGKFFAFTAAAAKYLAVAMAYDDVIRVADLKTRASRFERVRSEVSAEGDQIVYTTEFMHPRMEEVAGTLPHSVGLWLESRPAVFRWLDRRVSRGRRVRTGTIGWFLMLHLVGRLRRFRRGTLRHARETEHIRRWLDLAQATLPDNYDLAVEIIACRRLVKGYSDTHSRGEAKFDKVLSAVPLLRPRSDGGAWLRRLRESALLDEEGAALEGALRTVASL